MAMFETFIPLKSHFIIPFYNGKSHENPIKMDYFPIKNP
jgi:hypothetical protein